MTTKALEVGARYDAGDAETGAGVEVGGALGFADAGLGLMTPVAGLAISAAGGRTWSTGVRWTRGPDLSFGVEGTMREATGGGAPAADLGFRATARW